MADLKRPRVEEEVNEKDDAVRLVPLLKRETLVAIVCAGLEDNADLCSSVMQAANREDDCRNLFIRNLPFNATSDHLKEAFQPFGTLVDCTVVYDKKSSASKGYGFVKYDNARSALRAIDTDVTILGNSINKNFACLRAKSKSTPSPAPFVPPPAAQSIPSYGSDRKIMIRNLPFDATEDDVRTFFSRYGTLFDFIICHDHSTGKSKGYGFVTFTTDASTYACLSDPNPKVIRNRVITASLASQHKKPHRKEDTDAEMAKQLYAM
ncbi:hypothetical protein WA577_005083, partial [Blastocystis sp. JDR]